MLEVHGMIRVHGVALPVDFNLLCVLFQELEVVKILLF